MEDESHSNPIVDEDGSPSCNNTHAQPKTIIEHHNTPNNGTGLDFSPSRNPANNRAPLSLTNSHPIQTTNINATSAKIAI